ncbi:M99 family carboxypeptidase catalytic domain-containing protein [Campylobacter troglodytis]|uniref:M99 family carboxypeptidase catalytic domain-containing protein n=1 Tax=Campylobacter troglodytis TaxID=654363 RepID=UPI0011576BA6|nr:M99 family carboxypeptidase catalytic domain-containing protein [Campylobacter troglodytis]TQR60355.1 deacylase [Campylobacter troglodytis]
MKKNIFLILLINFACALEFTVSENGKSLNDNNTVLIFGGIQGDEPGGFHAASLLISDYNITKGKIIVAPNLAFDSIIKRSRGVKGDLNRKFAKLSKNDPDYETVQRIKNLILLPEVGMVLNLHDGWGFYRPDFIDEMNNPKRWGNSGVIDTKEINASKYNELESIAQKAVEGVNSQLIDEKHKYYLKNTKTEELADAEMLKALTYFVISNNKAAFANEASKNLPVHLRVYYHLVAIESYLKTAGIEFTRSFDLSPDGVKRVIDTEIDVKLFANKILLHLHLPRPTVRYLPFPLQRAYDYNTSNELTAVVADKGSYFVQYGNRFQTRIYPEYLEFSDAINDFLMIVDGEEKIIPFASKVGVKKYFMVPKIKGVRVNVIGLDVGKDESGLRVEKNKMLPQYSLDLAGKIFRVEFYELRGAKLEQQSFQESFKKLIKNPPQQGNEIYNQAKRKDKFLGSILVEFE